MPKLSPEERGEEGVRLKGIKEIYLGKGKIKGIYGDPAKEKLNKLTPKSSSKGTQMSTYQA